jgi:hypothetical protein
MNFISTIIKCLAGYFIIEIKLPSRFQIYKHLIAKAYQIIYIDV